MKIRLWFQILFLLGLSTFFLACSGGGKVSGTISGGNEGSSAPGGPNPPPAQTPPPAPTKPSAYYSVTFDWQPPTSGTVDRYWVWQTPNSSEWAVAAIVPETENSVTIEGYVPGNTYTVVLATQGDYLTMLPPMTFQVTGPGTHINVGTAANSTNLYDPVLTAPIIGSYSMLFQWVPPASTAGLTGYAVMQSNDAINWTVAAQVPANQLSVSISGYDWNQIYYMGIATVSAKGISSVNIITPMDYAYDLQQVNIYLLQPLNPP